ncbi:MAG: DUF4332 domain-containing protein [Spirulinaceae cyanobacterium RM2_2_10]|nr:DUF4332 domain-containing protein [Spirulinaceae cyanobacterium SM2_1_0]NJO20123.1 DUF4332 domain-containing protein [Spirulinaceae cyanobacterium RM2_2_10]
MPLSASSSEPPLAQLPGLSQANLEQLQALGLHTPAQLLAACTTPAARQDLAGQLQIQEQQVRKWAALADLARLPSVGCDYCGLLLHAGVASSAQLADSQVPNLQRQILKFQVATLRRRDLCPSLGQIQQWVTEAQGLKRL